MQISVINNKAPFPGYKVLLQTADEIYDSMIYIHLYNFPVSHYTQTFEIISFWYKILCKLLLFS